MAVSTFGDRVVARREEGRHVDAGDPGQPGQQLAPARAAAPEPAGGHRLCDLDGHLLAVAHREAVEEVGHRLGVEGARSAAHHQRIVLAALGRQQRDAGQVQHGQHAGVGQLELERHPEHVEGADRRARLEREEREPALPEHPLHVRPGQEDPLAGDVGPIVEEVVEEAEAQVGHPDLVRVGERQGEADPDLVEVLHHRAELGADVAGGLLRRRARARRARRTGARGRCASIAGPRVGTAFRPP